MTEAGGTVPPPTLEQLAYHWGGAYMICYVRDSWVALRRDTRYFLGADTLAELETLILADYHHQPVSRHFDPPEAADHLTLAGILAPPGGADGLDKDAGLDAERVIIVWELRRAFLAWAITYSARTRTTSKKTISVSSVVELCIALALIERRARQTSGEPD